MADLSEDDVRTLGRAVGIEIQDSQLKEVGYYINALRDLMDEIEPEGLDAVEALPVIPPHERSWHEQG
jgi:hypothetical protein